MSKIKTIYEYKDYADINKKIIEEHTNLDTIINDIIQKRDNTLTPLSIDDKELLSKIIDIIKDIKNLLPIQLKDKYISNSVNHRNNLFIALSSLGFINTNLLQFNIKNNKYLNIKLNILEDNNSFKKQEKDKITNLTANYETIYTIYKEKDILDITEISDTSGFNINTYIYKTLLKSTQPPFNVIWAYPLFNNAITTNKLIIKDFINEYMVKAKQNCIDLNEIGKLISDLKTKQIQYETIDEKPYNNSKMLFDEINNFTKQCIEDTQNILIHLKNIYNITFTDTGSATTPPTPPTPLNINDNTFGNLINNLMNNLANLKNIKDFIYKYIYEIFKYYILTQHTDDNFMVFCKSLNLDIIENVNDFISIHIFYTTKDKKNIFNKLKIKELNKIIVKHKTAYAAAAAVAAVAVAAPAYKTITNLQAYPPPTTTTTIATSEKMLEALNENLLYIHDNYYYTIMAYIYNFLHTNRFTHSTFINIMGVDLLCNDLNTIYDIYYKTIIQQPPDTKEAPAPRTVTLLIASF